MNREIKFRAWDKLNNKMTSNNISIDFVNNMCHLFYEEFKGNPTFITDFIPLQYTGLKDKNGVEIYEGNVILYNFGGKRYKGFVEYSDENAMYQIRDKAFINNLGYALDIEVIGNIYEK